MSLLLNDGRGEVCIHNPTLYEASEIVIRGDLDQLKVSIKKWLPCHTYMSTHPLGADATTITSITTPSSYPSLSQDDLLHLVRLACGYGYNNIVHFLLGNVVASESVCDSIHACAMEAVQSSKSSVLRVLAHFMFHRVKDGAIPPACLKQVFEA